MGCRSPFLATATAVLAIVLPAPALDAAVNAGEVVPFRGVAGAHLGMTRAAVVARLGPPVAESGFGVLSYSTTGILDVYLTRRGSRGRVRQVVASGDRFCAVGVPRACSLRPGSLRAMLRAYPGQFRRVVDATGDTIYWWCGRVRGRARSTSFNVDTRRGVILTWYIADHGARCPTLAQLRRGG